MTYNDLIKVAKQDPKNWKSIMTELSNNGAPADALGSKALIYACKNNNTEMARFLIERGALPRDRNSISLKYAVYYRNRELADLLISNRARVGRCNAWLRALIKQDLFLFKLKCLDNDFSLAALILKKFSIPKEQMMDLCLEDVLKTRSIHLLSVLIYECKKLPECPPDDEWAQNTRLFDDCSQKLIPLFPVGIIFIGGV